MDTVHERLSLWHSLICWESCKATVYLHAVTVLSLAIVRTYCDKSSTATTLLLGHVSSFLPTMVGGLNSECSFAGVDKASITCTNANGDSAQQIGA